MSSVVAEHRGASPFPPASRSYETAKRAAAKPFLDMLVYSRVTAHDRAATVILGDPTAAIPAPV